jgi:hypothetical protein
MRELRDWCNVPGKFGSDGKTFVADKDNRIWMVSNPETLSGMRSPRKSKGARGRGSKPTPHRFG